jgi:hypothetical protein
MEGFHPGPVWAVYFQVSEVRRLSGRCSGSELRNFEGIRSCDLVTLQTTLIREAVVREANAVVEEILVTFRLTAQHLTSLIVNPTHSSSSPT